MRAFDYAVADSVDAALQPNVTFLAGGTNLVDLMKLNVLRPELLVDVTALPFDEISDQGDAGVRIGALVRNSDLAAHPLIRRHYPVLAEAVLAGASGQLRNMATTGGNLLQRTRCGYFTDATKPCNKRQPGSGCPARSGDHRNLAVLGASAACVATHPSDMAVAMVALDAVIRYQDRHGPGELAVTDLHRLPGDTPHEETNLPPGALITAVDIALLHPGARSAYRKARDRASYAFAIGSVAAVLDLDEGGAIRDVRLGLGAVSPRPWRATIAENQLLGEPSTVDNYRRAAEAELAHAVPLAHNGYKVPLLRNMIVSVLTALTDEIVAARDQDDRS